MALLSLALYKPQSIPIMIDATADRICKKFRCSVCGDIVFEYYGSIKLIMHGHYEEGWGTVPTDEVDWFKTVGVPYPIECHGRLGVSLPNGQTGKTRCKTKYFKIGL